MSTSSQLGHWRPTLSTNPTPLSLCHPPDPAPAVPPLLQQDERRDGEPGEAAHRWEKTCSSKEGGSQNSYSRRLKKKKPSILLEEVRGKHDFQYERRDCAQKSRSRDAAGLPSRKHSLCPRWYIAKTETRPSISKQLGVDGLTSPWRRAATLPTQPADSKAPLTAGDQGNRDIPDRVPVKNKAKWKESTSKEDRTWRSYGQWLSCMSTPF